MRTRISVALNGAELHAIDAAIVLQGVDEGAASWNITAGNRAGNDGQHVNGVEKRYRDRQGQILFMDLRQMGSPYEKKYIELTREDRDKVTETYHNWQTEGYEDTYENVPEFCYSASFDEVKENGFTLVPSRYIEFVNRDENIDFDTKMKTLQSELQDLLVQEEKSKADLLNVFKEFGYEIKL